MKNSYAFKMMFRSPVKTALTVLLLATAAFLFLYNLFGFVLQRKTEELAEQNYRGILTIEHSMVKQMGLPQASAAFLLTDPTNPGETYGRSTNESSHHEPITNEEVEQVAALPYVDAVDRRYMTAGISEEYQRLDSYRYQYYGYGDRCILEGTVISNRVDEVLDKQYKYPEYATNGIRDIRLEDVKLLAGNQAWIDRVMEANHGQVKTVVYAMRDDKIGTGFTFSVVCGDGRAPVDCLDYDVTLDDVSELIPGRRYVFVLRAVPYSRSRTYFCVGDDFRKDWWPYFTDITDLPEDYLERNEFAELRSLIQVTNDDLRTFDVVYTDRMSTIRRVTQEVLTPVQGRFLGEEDRGKPVCVVSQTFASKYGLGLGDEISLKLGNHLMEQFVPLGAMAVTKGRYASEFAEQSFTIIGTYQDSYDGQWLSRDLVWAYSDNTIFVPLSFLPSGCDTEHHDFRPAELSFVVEDAWNIVPFSEESLPAVQEMGFRYLFADQHWPAIAERFSQAKLLSTVKLIVFSLSSLLACALSVYLFLYQRRKEYAILRALGCPRRKASAAILIPFFSLAVFSLLLGMGFAWLRSGALAEQSRIGASPAVEATIPAQSSTVHLFGFLLLLSLIFLFGFLYMYRLGKKSPWSLLQSDGNLPIRESALEAPPLTPAEKAALEAKMAVPVSRTGKPIRGFLMKYVWRHIRRAGSRSVLALLVTAVLVGAVGQLSVMKEKYAELVDSLEVEARYFQGLSYSKAETVARSGYVHDPKYLKIYDAEIELNPLAKVCFTNRLETCTTDPVTWLEGWDEEKAMSAKGQYCILPSTVMEQYGYELGDKARINEKNCLGNLAMTYPEEARKLELHTEELAFRDAHRPSFTIIGRVETEDPGLQAYIPASSFPFYTFFGTVLYLDEAMFTLNSYYEVESFREFSDRALITATDPPELKMDTSDADRIYRIYRLTVTIYPMLIAAALLLSALLPILMILLEKKEIAILRALGWSKKFTSKRLTLEQAVLCLAGLVLAVIALFAVNGKGFLGVILVPILYVMIHFSLCVGASVGISASILRSSPMRLLQGKE